MTPPLQKACKYLLIRQTQSHIITDVQFHVHITTLHFRKHLAQPRIVLLECLIWDHWNHHPNKQCNSHGFATRQHSSRTCRLVFCGSSSDSTCDACRMSCLLCHHMAGLIQNQKQIYQRQCAKIPKTISCNFGWTSGEAFYELAGWYSIALPSENCFFKQKKLNTSSIQTASRSGFSRVPAPRDLWSAPGTMSKQITKQNEKQQHWVIPTQWVLWFLDICTSL